MAEEQLPPDPAQQPAADDHFLEDMAALTGLFNPEVIWQKEMQLEDLKVQLAAEQQEPE